jgi:hypothetical protein
MLKEKRRMGQNVECKKHRLGQNIEKTLNGKNIDNGQSRWKRKNVKLIY